jgi:uncharacterized protein YdbL (DUF1318 family)
MRDGGAPPRRCLTGRPLLPAVAAACVLAGIAAGPASAATVPLFGVTVDSIAQVKGVTSTLGSLPRRATTRVYFNVHQPAGYYARALASMHPVSAIMGELLDSSDETSISTAALGERAREYLGSLGSSVDIWEVGNEVNGNWTGDYATVAEKLTVAFEAVAAAGGRTALTLYANNFGPDNCGDGGAELTPRQFSERYVPATLAAHLDYVLLSYYPTQCGGREPSSSEVASALEPLHAIYPNAALGFGEVGLPRRATRATRSQAQQIMRWAYALAPGLPYFGGGYFWWYGAEDALRSRAPLRGALRAAFESEAAALFY